MSHGEYSKEDARADLSASLTGLGAGLAWILVVGFISYEIAVWWGKSHGG